jgi:hypothetical protein
MMRQRWGTFSVIDHKDPARLIPEVLLYDHLVIPVPPTPEERNRWHDRGWEPDLLDERLAILGKLAVRANWGRADRESAYHRWAEQFAAIKQDTEDVISEAKKNLGYQLTRRVLANEKPVVVPKGVDKVDLVAAYQSEQDMHADFIVQKVADDRANLGLRLQQRIAVPKAGNDPLGALRRAVVLAQDADYGRKRQIVYDLQNQILSEVSPLLETVQQLDQAIDELSSYVELMLKPVDFTYAFTLAGVQPGLAVGQPFFLKSVATTQVVFRPREPHLAPSLVPCEPAAMYHDNA